MAQAKATPLGEAGVECLGELKKHPPGDTMKLHLSEQRSPFPPKYASFSILK